MYKVNGSSLEKFGIQSKCLHTSPQIRLFANVLSAAESQHMIECSVNKLKRAKVIQPDCKIEVDNTRTGRNCWLDVDADPVIDAVTKRIAECLSLDLKDSESLQLVHYRQGEKFDAHLDAFVKSQVEDYAGIRTKGQRLTTALIYLNDVAEGGHTQFPELHIKVKPKAGFMVAFENCRSDLITAHPLSLHGSVPVLKGEKWACNLFFRGQPRPGHDL